MLDSLESPGDKTACDDYRNRAESLAAEGEVEVDAVAIVDWNDLFTKETQAAVAAVVSECSNRDIVAYLDLLSRPDVLGPDAADKLLERVSQLHQSKATPKNQLAAYSKLQTDSLRQAFLKGVETSGKIDVFLQEADRVSFSINTERCNVSNSQNAASVRSVSLSA